MINVNPHRFIMVGCVCCLLLWSCRKDMTHTDTIAANSETKSSSAEDAPPVPANLRLDPTFEQTPFTARLTWDAPTSGIDILVYRGNSTQIETVVSVGTLKLFGQWQYELKNLQQNTTYTFQVQSQAFSGVRSAKTQPFTFTTLPTNDRTPPSAPVLTMQSPIRGFIIATWTVSTDNFDPSSELTYEIYNVQTGALVRKNLKSTRLESSFDNVQVFEDCVPYVVRARDRTGNLSAPSNAARAGCN
jgi:hypothetical protein